MPDRNRVVGADTRWLRRRKLGQSKHARRSLLFEVLEDRRLLTVELASVASSPPPLAAGELTSTNPMISGNGRYVVFQSLASDLVAGVSDVNSAEDVFVRDLELGVTIPISVVAGGGRTGDAPSFDPTISDDGRFVAFVSAATNLVAGLMVDSDTNVYVFDRDADADRVFDEAGPGATAMRLLSIGSDGTTGDGPSGGGFSPFLASIDRRPVISGDGSSVAFASFAPDLSLDDATQMDGNVAVDVFRASTSGGKLTLISVNEPGDGSCTFVFGATSTNPSIARTGSTVAFQSNCSDLTSAADGGVDDTNMLTDIFIGAGGAGAELVSINADGDDGGDGASREPVVSGNGRHVAFVSKATDLVRGAVDVNGFAEDVFVRDLKEERTTLVSRSRAISTSLTTGNDDSPSSASGGEFNGGPVINEAGRFVVFQSAASDLLDPADGVADTNGMPDLFVFDRDPDLDGVFDEASATRTILVSVNSAGTDSAPPPGGPCSSFAPSISRDGRYVAFASTCEDLIAGVAGANVYVRDLVTGTTALISDTLSGGAGGALTVAGGRTTSIDAVGGRTAFISDTPATDLDPLVTDDPNGEFADVFVGTPPPDIRGSASKADGFSTGTTRYQVLFEPVAPFEIGVYRSTDATFDASDELLGVLPLTEPDELDPPGGGRVYTIGTGPDEVALPGLSGALATESTDDYFILLVADHLDDVDEFDDDPFAEDNTGFFSAAYHEPGGPVFIHGRERDTPARSADRIIASSTATELTVTFGGAITGSITYDLADVTGLRIRTHGGGDAVVGSELPDFIHGGEGRDNLDGGAGDDVINGGPGADSIIGGPGADTIFDGCGDDFVDAGPDDDVVMSTPCSDDIFIDGGGSDTIDFSLDDLEITLDLDSTAVQTVDADLNTIQLVGQWENFVGSPLGNRITLRPLSAPRTLLGGAGIDHLIIDAGGNSVNNDGDTFTFPNSGLGDITYSGFEDIRVLNAAPQIIDDGEPGYSAPGFTRQFDPLFPQGFDGDIEFSGANSGNTASWTFSDVAPGVYQVAATWTSAPDRASSAPYIIRDGDAASPVVGQVRVDQEQAPGEFEDQSVSWQNLAVVAITGNQLTVQLTDIGANQDADDPFEFVIADAVRIEPISSALILDDAGPQFTPGANSLRTEGTGAFGGQHAVTSIVDPESGGLWACTQGDCLSTLPAGRYVVSATWSPAALSTPNATYQASDGGAGFNATVDQSSPPDDFREAGIAWERLGVIHLDPVVGFQVQLSGGPGEVLADAIRLDPAPRVQLIGPLGDTVTNGGLVDLGQTTIDSDTGQARIRSRFVIQNTGLANLDIGNLSVSGNGYSLVTPVAPMLPPGGSTEFEVNFTENQNGNFGGGLATIETNDFQVPMLTFNMAAEVVDDTAPPTVEIVSPDDGASYIEGSTINIKVDATDDIQVKRVELLADGQVVGTDSDAPYEFAFDSPVTGIARSLALGTRVFDLSDNSTDAITTSVNLLPDQPPAVQIVHPFNGDGVIEGSTLTVQVEADDDVAVTQVEFRVDGTTQFTQTIDPYVGSVQVPNVAGDHEIEVCATDTLGQVVCQTTIVTTFTRPAIGFRSIVVAPDPGQPPLVSVFQADGTETFRTFAYDPGFVGGVRVATGDINGDGTPDIITGAGPGGGPHVKVFDGATGNQIRSFFAFDGFTGGVFVSAGDVSGDGRDDIIVGADAGGGPHVKVFDGRSNELLADFFAFQGFAGGVRVAVGDLNGDGQADIITGAGAGGGPHVRVFDGHSAGQLPLNEPFPSRALLGDFFAFDPSFSGGVFVSGGDMNGDRLADVIVGADANGSTSGGHVRVIDATKLDAVDPNSQIADRALLANFFAFNAGFTGGVRVAAGDVNGDGTSDIITAAGPGGGPHVKVFDGANLASPSELGNFLAFDPTFSGGVFISGAFPPPFEVVNLPPSGGTYETFIDDASDDLVVRMLGGGELFRRPKSDLTPVRVNGAPNVDDLLIIKSLGTASPRLVFDGAVGGNDAIRIEHPPERPPVQYLQYRFKDALVTSFSTARSSFGQSVPLITVDLEPIEDNLEVFDRVFTFPDSHDAITLNTGGSTTDTIWRIDSDNSEVVDFEQPTGSLTIESGANDTADIGPDWTFEGTEVVDGKFARILMKDSLTLRMVGPRDWHNPVNPLDVNANGSVEAADVLIIFNELNTPKYRDATGLLADAAMLEQFPNFFFDSTGDGFVVPLDALIIINLLNRFGLRESEATSNPLADNIEFAVPQLIQESPWTVARRPVANVASGDEPSLPDTRPVLPMTTDAGSAPPRLTLTKYALQLDELLAEWADDGLGDELSP